MAGSVSTTPLTVSAATDQELAHAKVVAAATAKCRRCVVMDDTTYVVSGLDSMLTALEEEAAVFLNTAETMPSSTLVDITGLPLPSAIPVASQG